MKHIPAIHSHLAPQIEGERGGENVDHHDNPHDWRNLEAIYRGDEQQRLETRQRGKRVDETGEGEGKDHHDVVVHGNGVVLAAMAEVQFGDQVGRVGEEERPHDEPDDHDCTEYLPCERSETVCIHDSDGVKKDDAKHNLDEQRCQ